MVIVKKSLDELEPISKERLAEIAAIPDEEIDTSDIPELGPDFWANCRVVEPKTKQVVSIRFDREVLEWFKAQGKGYQTRMNAVLRAYIEAHRNGARQ